MYKEKVYKKFRIQYYTESGDMVVKKRVVIKGKVHDVGYRLLLLEEAESLGIPYFSARNIKNEIQAVEILVGAEEDKLEKFVDFVEKYCPEEAQIESTSIEDYKEEIRTIEAFSRSFSISQLSKIARTGVAMLNTQLDTRDDIKEMKGDIKCIKNKQEEHISITREMRDRQDEHISITREMRDRQDEHISITREMRDRQDEHIDITREMSEDVKRIRDKQDEHIGLTREIRGDIKDINRKQNEHIKVTKDGFESVAKELKELKDHSKEIRESQGGF